MLHLLTIADMRLSLILRPFIKNNLIGKGTSFNVKFVKYEREMNRVSKVEERKIERE